VPGPACYGRGGDRPTVTDADLVLGILNADNFLGGRLPLDLEAARTAIRSVAEPLGLSVEDAAAGIKRIADIRMADLLRTVTVERGHDPRDFALYAFGGAGATHAPAFALDVVDTIIVPASQAVHSALGAIASDIALLVESASPIRLARDEALPPEIEQDVSRRFEQLEVRAATSLAAQGVDEHQRELRRLVEVRFARQTKALPVTFDGSLDRVLVRFLASYAERYGSEAVPETAGFELVTLVVEGRGRLARPTLAIHDEVGEDARAATRGTRLVFDPSRDTFVETAVYDGPSLSAGNRFVGPAVIEYAGTTVALISGQHARVDRHLNIEIRKSA
jgi:N-methylhydantoinase A